MSQTFAVGLAGFSGPETNDCSSSACWPAQHPDAAYTRPRLTRPRRSPPSFSPSWAGGHLGGQVGRWLRASGGWSESCRSYLYCLVSIDHLSSVCFRARQIPGPSAKEVGRREEVVWWLQIGFIIRKINQSSTR